MSAMWCAILLLWALMTQGATPAQASETASACPPALPAAARDSAALDRGLLWRITRDGRSSWLYGTIHVGKPAWRRLGPRLGAALAASEVLALEIDPDDPALAQPVNHARPLQPPLPAALQERMGRAFERACVAAESLAGLDPLLQTALLMVVDARWLGMDASYAQERLLAAQAHQLGRRIVALESVAQQIRALVPDDDTQARAALEQSLRQLEDASGRRVLARLAAAWEHGDLATLDDYEHWCECADNAADRADLHRLNDERNPALADGIEALHRQGLSVLAAVGALHMTGPQALPRLLAQRGFAVERIGNGR